MSNYLIKQGQKWSVKVAIPAELQGVFGKKAFKKSLGTSDKAAAIARSGPLIAEFKDAIASARGNPEQHLDDYLAHTQAHLRTVKGDPDVNPDQNMSQKAWPTAPAGDGTRRQVCLDEGFAAVAGHPRLVAITW